MKNTFTKIGLYLAFALLSTTSLLAQAFTLHPDLNPSQTIQANGGGELHIDGKNISGNYLLLSYELVSDTYDPAWSLLFCDHGLCFTDLRAFGTMDTIYPGDSVMVFKVTLNPSGVAGSGTATYRVWDSANPSDEQTISISFDVEPAVGLEEEALAAQVQIFPQPATDRLNLVLPAELGRMEMDLIGLNGTKVASYTAAGTAELDLNGIAPGIYILRLHNDKHELRKRFAITR